LYWFYVQNNTGHYRKRKPNYTMLLSLLFSLQAAAYTVCRLQDSHNVRLSYFIT